MPSLLRRHTTVAVQPTERQAQRRLTTQQVEQLVAANQAGASVRELAAKWRLHRTTVAAQLRRAGVKLRYHGISADRIDDVVRLYGEGWSCQRLAERYKCDNETVRQALTHAGLALRLPWRNINNHDEPLQNCIEQST